MSIGGPTRTIATSAVEVEAAFPFSGKYEIVVGSGFDTPSPKVDGWCEVSYERTDPYPPYEEPTAQLAAAYKAKTRMMCSPSLLTDKSMLTIQMPFPHGQYLSVVFENDYAGIEYLSYPVAAPGWPLLEPGDFERMRSLSLRVTDVKVRTQKGSKRIFVKPGRYLIQVGANFETDDPEFLGWCRVTYRPTRRS